MNPMIALSEAGSDSESSTRGAKVSRKRNRAAGPIAAPTPKEHMTDADWDEVAAYYADRSTGVVVAPRAHEPARRWEQPGYDPTSDLSVHVVVNGALGMSAGKIAAQSFQACQRLLDAATQPQADPKLVEALGQWRQMGTRTIVMVAKTQHAFDRLLREVDGVTMVDEGVNEVDPGTATIFASWPVRRGAQPSALKSKRVTLMRTPA